MSNGYVVDEARLSRLEDMVEEARKFALEARDSSRSNAQTIQEVLLVKAQLIDAHEIAIQQTRGSLRTFAIIGAIAGLVLAALPFIVHR